MTAPLRKQLKRELVSARKHAATIEYLLSQHEEIMKGIHPDLAEIIHHIREGNSIVDDLIEELQKQI